MPDKPKPDRHSNPVRVEASPPLTEEQKARQEALNTLLQYDRMTQLIDEAIQYPTNFRLRPHVLQELNRISIQKIESEAGRWRAQPMQIEQSSHTPPSAEQVPKFIDEMCEYVNDNWRSRSGFHLAAYVMWRLNWIHPFIDGNGRTTRATSYLVLCAKLGFRIPGVTTIPELISKSKSPYYEALEAADRAETKTQIDVSAMELLLKNLLAAQMVEAIEKADSVVGIFPPPAPTRRGVPVRGKAVRSDHGAAPVPSWKLGAAFGALTLIFFMALVLLNMFGHPLPDKARFLVIIVMALSGGLSSGYLGGYASAHGSVPLSGAEEHPMRYGVSGGIAVFIILLVLGKFLFL